MIQLYYFIRRAVGDMRENGLNHLLSIGTIATSFFLFGSFLLLAQNFGSFLGSWEKKVQIILYLKDGVSETEVLRLQERLRDEEGIENIRYISKRDALEVFKEDLAGYGGVLDGLKEEFFPASLEMMVGSDFRTPEQIRALATRLNKTPQVEEAQYGGLWLERLSVVLYILKWGSWVLGAVLVMIIVSVTANTVRLTLYNKGEEIEILKLVGASETVVTVPFYLEGGLQGFLGATGSLVLLFFIFHIFSLKVSPFLSLYFGQLRLSFLPIELVAAILGVGMISGLLGGIVSVRKAWGT